MVLLQGNANPDESDGDKVSVLHFAAFDGQLDSASMLLLMKADPNTRDKHGQTPLFFAPSTKMCEALFNSQADCDLQNRHGQTAVHLAGRSGNEELLLWFANKVSKHCFNLQDCHGASALYYAAHAGVHRKNCHKMREMRMSTYTAKPITSSGAMTPSMLSRDEATDTADDVRSLCSAVDADNDGGINIQDLAEHLRKEKAAEEEGRMA